MLLSLYAPGKIHCKGKFIAIQKLIFDPGNNSSVCVCVCYRGGGDSELDRGRGMSRDLRALSSESLHDSL